MHHHIGRHRIGAASHRSHKVPLRNCSARCRWLALLAVIRLQEEYIDVLRCKKVESLAIEMRIMPIHEYILWSLRPTVLHELCAYLKGDIAVLVTGWCSMNDPVARKSQRLEF